MATTLRHTPCVTASVHDDGLTLLHIRADALFSSNRTGALIWSALEQCASPDAIAAMLRAAYGIDCDLARAHVRHFIGELQECGLIERSSTP
jgi:hypothetical protein